MGICKFGIENRKELIHMNLKEMNLPGEKEVWDYVLRNRKTYFAENCPKGFYHRNVCKRAKRIKRIPERGSAAAPKS